MPIVTDSIETLRSYRANLAIVTQTIPALDEIYGENARRALQGNAGIKLYPSTKDQMRGLQGQIKVLEQKIGALQMPVGEKRNGARRPEVKALITDEKGALPDAPTDVEAYQNTTARVDQFLEKVADD